MAISISDIIAQNTLGKSEGFPLGVPQSYNWYKGWNDDGMKTPPSYFTAVEGWGQVYQKVGAATYVNANASVEVANAKTYVRLKATGEWVLVQDQSRSQIAGGHFVTDFSGNAGYAMKVNSQSNGAAAFAAPPSGYNDHFWYGSRGTYAAGAIDAVYVQMDMRVTDPKLNLVASVGADWWRDASAPYLQDHSNNPGVGSSNWSVLSTEWTTLGYYSLSTAEFQADLPPPLLGAGGNPPVVVPPDTVAPDAPKLVGFAQDTGVAGDRITSASVLTLSGTAEANSTVRIFDGATQIGSVRAGGNGAWSLSTPQLQNGTHAFTARATDAAGNVSVASAALNVQVDTIAPQAPKVVAFSPDEGTIGDGATGARRLTLSGSAEAGSTVRIFDSGASIGTATVNSSGSWSFATAELSYGAHNFTATATDVAGNTGASSAVMNVTVTRPSVPPDTSTPPPKPPVVGDNLLVNGSFEDSAVSAGRWAGFSSIPGWTAISGGTIELWNNLNNVTATDGMNFGELDYVGARDGLYQDVNTAVGQTYNLAFDARSRPGFSGATCSMEVLWNDQLIATVPPGNSWSTYNFTVTGTGGLDRLTFREVAGQGGDGLGALYDNVRLTVQGASSASLATASQNAAALDLMMQYSATVSPNSAPIGVLPSSEATSSLSQVLARSTV
ncbi:Ig-like domain-containing protein [Tardiphaga sp.]|jgi:hypothetical protein|uniref:Ig-like domain-containing protein n=1 Tax=Tardiphaga sp. TaxID=1926292 RepID=UPI0037D9E979